jgi:hypothetical protein
MVKNHPLYENQVIFLQSYTKTYTGFMAFVARSRPARTRLTA